MGKGKIILIVVVLALVLMGGIGILMLKPMKIHGYDGPVAKITEIDHSYSPRYVDVRESILPNAAHVYPYAEDIHDLVTETGLRLEIRSAPNVLKTIYIETITEAVVDKVAKTNTTRNWDVQRVKCSMGATVWTYEGGNAKCGQTVFWVTLEDNADSIFSTLDEHYAFFVNIYNIDPVSIVGEMEVTPTATIDYVYEPLPADPVPQWVLDSGYTDEVNNHRVVKFPITVLNAQPILLGEVIRAQESSATFYIGFDVILFGYWEQTVDYREHRIPEPEDLLEDLIVFLTLMAWVILGFVATVVVFRFVPDWRMKLLATAIIWAVVAVIYGYSSIVTWLEGAG